MMKRVITILLALSLSASLWAQTDRSEVRAGNRKFRKEDYKNAEIDYRRALVKDSLSLAGCYNLASTLYRMEDWDGAQKALEPVKEAVAGNPNEASYWYNSGDAALQKKDYAAAVDAFRQSLLKNPGDMDAKENYIYAKKMLENQQQNGGGGGQNDQNQDQNQNNDQNQQNHDQNQNGDQNQDQNNQNQDNQDQNGQGQQDQQNQPQQNQGQQQSKISPQQAQQMLQAIQAKEKETQDKVNKEKAEALKSRQKEKNW